jgi:hypothetical protein
MSAGVCRVAAVAAMAGWWWSPLRLRRSGDESVGVGVVVLMAAG